MRILRRLIRVLRAGLCARAGACVPRRSFVGYFGIRESEVYTSEFTVRALSYIIPGTVYDSATVLHTIRYTVQ